MKRTGTITRSRFLPAAALAALLSSCGSPPADGVAIVRVYGPIQTEPDETMLGIQQGGADAVVRKIRGYRKNERVKAIVLRINSPGGTVAASQEILSEIKQAKKDGKKVVVSMADLAASGGYYIACHADEIYADPGTITGSIGVYMGAINATKLAKKIGVKVDVIKSGEHKDIMSPWRDMTDQERDLIQEAVMDVYEQFVSEVASGRNMKAEKVRPLADGRIYTGRQAKKVGLVDKMGGLHDAIRAAAKLAGIEGEPAIIKDYDGFWGEMLSSMEPTAKKNGGLVEVLAGPASTTDFVPVTYMMPRISL
ncbi:MAG: signal peptide peptidase SppA [Deltaproteobacteria bacterium]|nr:signal peptide peptidase SppA [Deltaproteobacteria bacterium]